MDTGTRVDKSAVPVPGPFSRVVEVREQPLDIEQGRRFLKANGGPVTAPRPILGTRAKAGANRIRREIGGRPQEMAFALQVYRAEAVLEQMGLAAMPAIEPQSKASIELFHRHGDVAVQRDDDEVVVVRHQSEAETLDTVPLVGALSACEQIDSVAVVDGNRLPVAASGEEVIDAPGVKIAWRTWHRHPTVDRGRAETSSVEQTAQY